jgi:hypothetical protein
MPMARIKNIWSLYYEHDLANNQLDAKAMFSLSNMQLPKLKTLFLNYN